MYDDLCRQAKVLCYVECNKTIVSIDSILSFNLARLFIYLFLFRALLSHFACDAFQAVNGPNNLFAGHYR